MSITDSQPEAIDAIAARVVELLQDRTPQPLITAEQAGELLSVPASWLMSAARKGQVPHRKLGHYTRFDAAELRAWLDAQARGTS
jgi:predicted DNA-binding transcriptional regulator AlpA